MALPGFNQQASRPLESLPRGAVGPGWAAASRHSEVEVNPRPARKITQRACPTDPESAARERHCDTGNIVRLRWQRRQ